MTETRAAIYGRQSRGKEKSIGEQIELCTRDAAELGWAVVATYRDRTSASRYRRVDREEWGRVVAGVSAGEFDVLVIWATSRADRDLTSWSGLLDACRRSGVLLRITDDERTYDVRKGGDWQALAQQGVGNAVDSDKISAAVQRGQAGSARQGRPGHGRCPYGYRRVFDPASGALLGQEPDPATAAVVAEIIGRVARSEPVSRIAKDLQGRDVPRPEAGQWHNQRVRDVAGNAAYIGRRVYRGQEYEAGWPALVDPVTFYAARRVLADPARTTTRPGGLRHLLTYLAVCDVCDGPLCAVRGRYRCLRSGCVTIAQEQTDALVTEAVLVRLGHPDIYKRLRQAGDEADREAVEADKEAARLTDQLNGWRLSAAKGQTTPESLAVIEADLDRQIKAAQRRSERAGIPPALRDVLEPGADVAVRWAALTLPAKRAVILRLVDTLRISAARSPGSRAYDPTRLDASRWRGDVLTWGQLGLDTPER